MMCIAIYIGDIPAKKEDWTTKDWFNYEVLSRMISRHPEEKFLILSDGVAADFFSPYKNAGFQALGQYVPKFLSIYRRYNYQLPAITKQSGCRIFVSMTGVMPLKNRLPSCLLIPDELLVSGSRVMREGIKRYSRRYLSRFVQRATHIATLSNQSATQALSRYQLPQQRITTIYNSIPGIFKPMTWENREEVKSQYAEGKEFLLYAGDISKEDNIINLLKAFSMLKKKMNSGIVLVFAGRQDKDFKKFPELLRTYHFRNDVKLTGAVPLPEIARLTGAAYARIVSAAGVDFCSPVPEALQCLTPVIAADSPLHREAGGDAALYFAKENFQQLGEHLCELYKNEELRARLIARSGEKAKDFSRDAAAGFLWEAILKTGGQTTKK